MRLSLVLLSVCLLAGVAGAQPNSPKCIAATNAVSQQEKKISDFEATKNQEQYAGSGISVFMFKLKELRQQLEALRAAEQIFCSAQGTAAAEGLIKPKYMILTVLYAPPGTTGGRGASFVEYAQGSSTGTTVSTASSFKSDYAITGSVEVGSTSATGASVSLGVDWTDATTSKTEVSFKKTDKNDIKVSAPAADGIDHNEDRIYVWLNPVIHVTVKGKQLVFYPAVDGPSLDALYFYPAWLKDPSTMPPDLAKRLAARGLTADDYKTILSADPFATGSTAIDANRFIQTSTTFPYEPPLSASDGPTLQTYTLTNESADTNTKTNTTSTTVDLKIVVSASAAGIVKVSLQNEDKWTWTHENVAATSSGSSESASAAVGDPSFGYEGPVDIAVYWDTMFHSFLFAPQAYPSPGTADRGAFSSGTITDSAGKPVVGKEVTLVVPGRRFRTFTDRRGQYRFFWLAARRPVGLGTLKVAGIARSVRLTGRAARLDVRLPPHRVIPNIHHP